MEYGGGGGGGGGGSGGEPHDSDPHQRKKRYHRHSAHQIQRLETMFKECPHPDEKTRLQLSRELHLAPRQIKFWFQNRRTQMKAQHERQDNCALRAENDKIRCENIAIREALKNVICPSCGGGPSVCGEDSYFDEQKLRIENAQLKEELDKVSSIAAKYIGRPISQLPPVQPIHISSLDLSMSSYGGGGGGGGGMGMVMVAGPSLDLDLLPGSSSSINPSTNASASYHQTMSFSDMDKSLMADIAGNAMNELIRLFQTNEPLWIKCSSSSSSLSSSSSSPPPSSSACSSTDVVCKEVLNLEVYDRIFPTNNHNTTTSSSHLMKNPNVRIESSRASGVVIMNALALVDMLMDANKWVELFPTIVSRARTVEVLSSGILGSQSGTLLLMYEELQILSPFVPTRQLYYLRFCQQIEQGSWAIVDVSYDFPNETHHFGSHFRVHKFPSGCLIQDMPNGYSKVTWVEHSEMEEKEAVHPLFRDLIINSGMAFGADRWLTNLQRMCERYACLMVAAHSTRDLGGVMPSPEGKRSMMKLAQRMVSTFCASINPSNGHQWTTLSAGGGLNSNNNNNNNNEFEVRATLHKSTDPGQPNGVVLSAATTIWLPFSPIILFNFFRDERTRHQWDILSNQNPVQEVFHIANGSHPGNCISVLRAYNTSQNNRLILQESCTDSSGCLVVFSSVDLPQINIAMSGEDPSYIQLLPSGFTISPDGRQSSSSVNNNNIASAGMIGDGTGIGSVSGSLLTVVLQILVSSLPSAKMSPESVNTVNNLISNTVHQIKAALNCSTPPT